MNNKQENKNPENKTGEFENSKIPSYARKTLGTMLVVMLGYGLFPSTINTGAIIASNFNFGVFLIIILIGNLILTIYALLMSMIGLNSNASLHNLSKRVFGRKGYKVTSTILVISQIGWFGVGIMLISAPMLNLLNVNDMSIYGQIMSWIITIVMGSLITSSAFFGVKALKFASLVAIPIVLGSGLLVIILSLIGGDWGSFDPSKVSPDPDISFFFAVGLVVSTFISGATLIPDFIRWAKNRSQAILVVFLTFLVLQTILLFFGAMAYYGIDTSLFGDYNNDVTLYSSLSIMGLGFIGFIALFANVWTSNDNSLYSTGLGVSSMFKIDKKYAVIILGTIGTILAPLFATSGFVWFLSLLGYLIPGIGAIMIFDYYIFYKWLNVYGAEDYFYFLNDDYENYKLVGLISWSLGIVLSLIMQLLLPFIVPLYIIFITGLIYTILELIKIKWINSKNKNAENINDISEDNKLTKKLNEK